MSIRTIIFSLALLSLSLLAPRLVAQDVVNWLQDGDVHFRLLEFESAMASYDMHIADHPQDPKGFIHRARLHAVLGNQVASRNDLTIAHKLNPLSYLSVDSDLRSSYVSSKFYDYESNSLDDAFYKSPIRLEDYKLYLEEHNSFSEPDSVLMRILTNIKVGDFRQADFALSTITMTSDNLPILYDMHGLVDLKQGKIVSAIDFFSLSIDMAPEYPLSYHNRAVSYKALGQYEQAHLDITEALLIQDDLPVLHFTDAKIYQKKNNIAKAMASYERALELDETYVEAITNYSQLLKYIGEFDKSLVSINTALISGNETLESKYLQANRNFVYGNFRLAKKGFEEYLDSHPNDPDVIYNLGLSEVLLHSYEEGCEHISLSLQLQQNDKRNDIYESFCAHRF